VRCEYVTQRLLTTDSRQASLHVHCR
jgi:hypothetical protein